MKRVLILTLTGFVFLAIVVVLALRTYGVSVAENVLPQLLGFCLEGIFFVALFALVADHHVKSQELSKKRELKLTVVRFLGIFLMWAHFAGFQSRKREGKSTSEDGKLFDVSTLPEMIAHIEASESLGVASNFLRDFAERESTTLTSFLPVVAGIGPDHLLHWGQIINFLQGIKESENDKKLKEVLVAFLKAIQSFDELPINA